MNLIRPFLHWLIVLRAEETRKRTNIEFDFFGNLSKLTNWFNWFDAKQHSRDQINPNHEKTERHQNVPSQSTALSGKYFVWPFKYMTCAVVCVFSVYISMRFAYNFSFVKLPVLKAVQRHITAFLTALFANWKKKCVRLWPNFAH